MPLGEITPLHLSREWNRLLKSGGHHRKTKQARPLSAKTVRHIAGLVSSAFARAERWGLVATNPVKRSEPPVPKKHRGVALTPAQQALVFASATGPWCMATFLELCAATGARRGEVLALRWSDIQDGRAIITRSLTQTKQVLEFKGTKTEKPRDVKVPESALAALEAHRKRQDEFRRAVRADYRTDLDLIFANPDGTPLRPNSISSVRLTAVPPARSSQGSEPALPAPQPRLAPGRRRRAACRWLPSAWGTPRSGRRRMFTRTLSAAKTMTRPDVGMNFSAALDSTSLKKQFSSPARIGQIRV